MKLAIVVGTRPEIIRLACVIKKAREVFEVSLIHTGQNYDHNLNQVFFDDLDLASPEHYLNCDTSTVGTTVGDIITKTYALFSEIKPDAVLILGDTNSCLSVYSAKRLKIPVFHMEAGNRCGDVNVPEEINRRIVDHTADVNICYTEHARRNLIAEGINNYVFVVGSPMKEVVNYAINKKPDLDTQPVTGDYILFSSHREENVNLKMDGVIECLRGLASEYPRVLVSLHPRTRKVLETNNIQLPDNVVLHEPYGYLEYLELQRNAICVVSDSGTLTEEASILGFSAVLLRDSTEHPEGIEYGDIVLGSVNWESLGPAVRMVIKKPFLESVSKIDWYGTVKAAIRGANSLVKTRQPYDVTDVSVIVCRIIQSYTSIVNTRIWRKN